MSVENIGANLTCAEEEEESSKNCCQQSSVDEEEDEEGVLLLTVHPQGQASRLKAGQVLEVSGTRTIRNQDQGSSRPGIRELFHYFLSLSQPTEVVSTAD